MAKTSHRSVYYYRIFNPDGAIDFAKKLQKVCSLPEGTREYVHQDVTVNISINAKKSVDGVEMISGIIRLLRYVAPSVGARGTNNSHPISLEEDEGVNEKTHFVYVPASKALAVEYNHHGPKVDLLIKMINEQYETHFDETGKKTSYIYLASGNAVKRIQNAVGIKRIHFEYIDEPSSVNESMPLLAAQRQALAVGDTQAVEMILKPERGSRDSIMSTKEFIAKFLPGLKSGGYKKLKVKIAENETGSSEEIDLVKDKLVKDFSVVLLSDGTKEINSRFLLESMEIDMADRRL